MVYIWLYEDFIKLIRSIYDLCKDLIELLRSIYGLYMVI